MQADLHEALDDAAPRRVPDLDFDRLWRRHRRAQIRNRAAVVATVAVAVAVAIAVTVFPGGRSSVVIDPMGQGPDPEEIGVGPAETIRQLVDALNTVDAQAFIDSFIPEGSFHARGQFGEGSSLFANHQKIADTGLVEPWMRMLSDTWGLEARVHRCTDRPDLGPGFHSGGRTVTCEVTTRWHALSLEITEQWEFEFVGDLLASYRWQPLDLDPPNRSLPLGFSGLEQWEAWLQANDPAAAARLLVARDAGCDPRAGEAQFCDLQWVEDLSDGDWERAARMAPLVLLASREWTFDGHAYTPSGLVPYDPALAEEIEASIRDYLASLN